MSKNIKIELELPEFDKELTISINLRKDGEVISTSSFPTGAKTIVSNNNISSQETSAWKQPVEDFSQYDCPPKPETVKKKKSSSGNMMDADF